MVDASFEQNIGGFDPPVTEEEAAVLKGVLGGIARLYRAKEEIRVANLSEFEERINQGAPY